MKCPKCGKRVIETWPSSHGTMYVHRHRSSTDWDACDVIDPYKAAYLAINRVSKSATGDPPYFRLHEAVKRRDKIEAQTVYTDLLAHLERLMDLVKNS